MDLQKLTKTDLIFLIRKMESYGNGTLYLDRAIAELDSRKESRRMEEADRFNELWARKLREYNKLMEPYNGKKIVDIPDEVFHRARILLQAADAANEKWKKLMGIKWGKEEE